jgi:hypothetical protein
MEISSGWDLPKCNRVPLNLIVTQAKTLLTVFLLINILRI